MTIKQKLLKIQTELKAPKNQFNKFGNYKYRNAEDILEAVKPLLFATKTTTTISDEVVNIAGRFYVRSTATLFDTESDEFISVNGFAREEESKKGMDGSQITGASSSYARKYALNGLFAIDDTKDSDTTNEHGRDDKPEQKKPESKTELDKAVLDKINKAKTEVELKNIWFELSDEERPKYTEVISTRKSILKANKG